MPRVHHPIDLPGFIQTWRILRSLWDAGGWGLFYAPRCFARGTTETSTHFISIHFPNLGSTSRMHTPSFLYPQRLRSDCILYGRVCNSVRCKKLGQGSKGMSIASSGNLKVLATIQLACVCTLLGASSPDRLFSAFSAETPCLRL